MQSIPCRITTFLFYQTEGNCGCINSVKGKIQRACCFYNL